MVEPPPRLEQRMPASVAVFIAVLTLNLIGDALRDVTDPRLVTAA